MDHLRDLLPKTIKKHGLKSQTDAALVLHHTNNWIEEHMSAWKADLKAQSYKDGTLVIEAQNSIASQECHQAFTKLRLHLREHCEAVTPMEMRVTRSFQKAER